MIGDAAAQTDGIVEPLEDGKAHYLEADYAGEITVLNFALSAVRTNFWTLCIALPDPPPS